MSLFSTCKLSSQHECRGIFIILSVLFCVCASLCAAVCACTRGWVQGGREGVMHVFCVRSCVGVCFTKCFSLKKFQTLSRAFWLAEKCRKSNFLLKFLQQRSCGASSVSVKGIGSSHWHKYNLSSRSGASFWINSVCGVSVYQAGRHRAHGAGEWDRIRPERQEMTRSITSAKSLQKVLKSAFVSVAPG